MNHLSLPISVEKWKPVENNHKNFNDIEKEWSDSFFSLTKLLASPYSLSIHSNVAKMFWKILVGRFSIVYLKILSLSGWGVFLSSTIYIPPLMT